MDGLCEGEKEGTSRADDRSDRFRSAPFSPSGSFSTSFSSSSCPSYRETTGSRSSLAIRCTSWRLGITLSSHFSATMVSLRASLQPGKQQKSWTDAPRSIAFLASYGVSAVTCGCPCRIMGGEPVRCQPAKAFCARVMGWSRSAEAGVGYLKMYT